MDVRLPKLLRDFAAGMTAADARRPVFVSRSGRAYLPGIGPHAEDTAVRLVVEEMRRNNPNAYARIGQKLPYQSSKQTCDLWVGEPLEWAVEVKMARFYGDNGKPDDTSLKELLSPYPQHRSALTDCTKLAACALRCRRAILIYGFDYAHMPLDAVIDAFEALAGRQVELGTRYQTSLGELVHPVHAGGRVFAWEILRLRRN